MSTQNEALTKRIDDLESRHSKKMGKSSSLRSFSTLNNTLIESDMLEDMPKGDVKNLQNLNISGFLSCEMEWKKDIEKSIETISEKVAANSSSVLVNLLEKRVNDMNNEFSKLKRSFEDTVENTSVIRRNIDKFDKTEKLISGLLGQMSEMRNSNIKWQADFLKNLNDFNEKIMLQESTLEDFEKFEKNVRKRIDNFNSEIKAVQNEFKIKITDFDFKHTEKSKVISDEVQNLINENWKLSHKFTEEVQKVESKYSYIYCILVSNKALWDSFTLFSSTLDNKNIN